MGQIVALLVAAGAPGKVVGPYRLAVRTADFQSANQSSILCRVDMKKVHSLALGTGYAETASWSHLLLYHPAGFDCIQDALVSIHNALKTLIHEETQDHNKYVDMMNRWAVQAGESPTREHSTEPYMGLLEGVLETIIHGSFQDYSNFWEILNNIGWECGSSWLREKLGKHPTVFIDTAPQIVLAAIAWEDQKMEDYNELWYAKEHLNTPKGIKTFRYEVKKRNGKL